jgi:5-formyltetrahydrofolate cyclo-ligase
MPDEDDLTEEKSRLREEINARRNALLPHVRTAKSHAALERLEALPAYGTCKYPLIYIAMASEVQTLPLVDRRLAQGRSVTVPKVEGESLGLYEIESVGELAPGVWGILEPQAGQERPAEVARIDVVVMPGVVFDAAGHRLGYGKAYYDRMLRSLAHPVVKIALAFEVQMAHRVPAEAHDVHVDFVVTEERTIDCAAVRTQELEPG